MATDKALTIARVGLMGLGGVGQAVVRGATSASDRLAEAGVLVKCIGALVRDEHKPRVAPEIPLWTSVEGVPYQQCDVIVEALGGLEPARTLVSEALRRRIPVVTANKSLVAAHGLELQALAQRCGTTLSFEAAVLAGVPCVNTLASRPLASGVGAYTGILNGTSHFLLTRLAQGASADDAWRDAVARGYAEPGSDNDISGRDAAEKLTILLHLAGHTDVTVRDLPRRTIADLAPWHLALAARLFGVIKPVALAVTRGPRTGAWVGPVFVSTSHPFARLSNVDNVLTIGDHRDAVTFSGPGAGPDVTAATILDDIVEVVAGRRSQERPRAAAPVAPLLRAAPAGKWFVTVARPERVAPSLTSADLAEFLAARHVPALCVTGEGDRHALITAPVPEAQAQDAVQALEATGLVVTCWPVLEHGEVHRA